MEGVNISSFVIYLNHWSEYNLCGIYKVKLAFSDIHKNISSYEKGVSKSLNTKYSHSDWSNTTNALKIQRSAIVHNYAIQLA